jgi:hypothetical protein
LRNNVTISFNSILPRLITVPNNIKEFEINNVKTDTDGYFIELEEFSTSKPLKVFISNSTLNILKMQ